MKGDNTLCMMLAVLTARPPWQRWGSVLNIAWTKGWRIYFVTLKWTREKPASLHFLIQEVFRKNQRKSPKQLNRWEIQATVPQAVTSQRLLATTSATCHLLICRSIGKFNFFLAFTSTSAWKSLSQTWQSLTQTSTGAHYPNFTSHLLTLPSQPKFANPHEDQTYQADIDKIVER